MLRNVQVTVTLRSHSDEDLISLLLDKVDTEPSSSRIKELHEFTAVLPGGVQIPNVVVVSRVSWLDATDAPEPRVTLEFQTLDL